MVLNNLLTVTNPGMKHIITNDTLREVVLQLIPQCKNQTKAKLACLIYGHPGAGKTRLFRDLTAALTGCDSGEFYDQLSAIFREFDLNINISDTTVAVATFNRVEYKCTYEDAKLCYERVDLPVALRLFFVYFEHGYSRDGEGF